MDWTLWFLPAMSIPALFLAFIVLRGVAKSEWPPKTKWKDGKGPKDGGL